MSERSRVRRVRVCVVAGGDLLGLKKIAIFFAPLFVFSENGFVGAAQYSAAPTNRFVGAADNTSRPYKSAICSQLFIGTAGKTAPTEGYQPSLKKIFYVVSS